MKLEIAPLKLFWIAAALACLVIAGCAQREQATTPLKNASDFGAGNFMVPQSGVEYTARYVVNENGAETEKTVWRSERKMRVDYASYGKSVLSMFFLQNKAYSCSAAAAGWQCFDISANIDGKAAENLFSPPDLSGAEAAEEVDIGNTKGKCYLLPSAPFETRKMCLTDRQVVAYDEYNMTKGKQRVEYLTDIYYGVGENDFALPAEPQPPPPVGEAI